MLPPVNDEVLYIIIFRNSLAENAVWVIMMFLNVFHAPGCPNVIQNEEIPFTLINIDCIR